MTTDTIEHGSVAAVLADSYTREIGDWAKKQLPVTLENDEYLSRISAVIVALNRILAEYVATSAHVHQLDDQQARDLVDLTGMQFCRNYVHAIAAIVGKGSTVQ